MTRMKKANISKALIASLLVLPVLMTVTACNNEFGSPSSPTQEQTNGGETASPSNNPENPTDTQEKDPKPNDSDSKPPTPIRDTAPDSLKVYWLTAENEEFALSASPLKLNEDVPESEQLTQAIERLVKGPANADVTSAVPDNTKLNNLAIKDDGIHIDLSKEFTDEGGSLSMQSRLGQVIYTASSIKPKTPVWISIDGEPLTVLGGEGLELSQPMTREEFSREFSI